MNLGQGELFGSNGHHSRAEQIKLRFKLFHAENPLFWKLFKHYAFQVLNSGHKFYSVAAIFERIRWHVDIETKSEEAVKLNNDYRAYYARMFEAVFDVPLFRKRRLRSGDSPAQGDDLDTFIDGPPDSESEMRLREELKTIGQ